MILVSCCNFLPGDQTRSGHHHLLLFSKQDQYSNLPCENVQTASIWPAGPDRITKKAKNAKRGTKQFFRQRDMRLVGTLSSVYLAAKDALNFMYVVLDQKLTRKESEISAKNASAAMI